MLLRRRPVEPGGPSEVLRRRGAGQQLVEGGSGPDSPGQSSVPFAPHADVSRGVAVGEERGPFCWPHEGWCRHGRAASAAGTSGREKRPWLSVGPGDSPKCTGRLGMPGRGLMGHSVPWANSWCEMRPFLSWGSAGLPGTGQRVPSRLLVGTVLAFEVTGAGAGSELEEGAQGLAPRSCRGR